MLRREILLGAGAAAVALVFGRSVEAQTTAKAGVLTSTERGSGGVTFTLAPKSAAFPCPGGKPYNDRTTLVFVPDHFRLPRSGRVDFVVHFHGHNTTAEKAIVSHKLREQLRDSKQNAVLVVPQGAVNQADGDFGKLMLKGGLGRLVSEIRGVLGGASVSKTLGDATLAKSKRAGRVVLSAHSGGYRAAAACSKGAGVDISEVYLFDALYGDVDAFAAYVERSEDHKLVSYSIGGAPRENSKKLAQILTAKGVDVRQESGAKLTREELVRGRAVFLEGHSTHAAATFEEQALRDCLLASCLVGRGSRAWHEGKNLPRAT